MHTIHPSRYRFYDIRCDNSICPSLLLSCFLQKHFLIDLMLFQFYTSSYTRTYTDAKVRYFSWLIYGMHKFFSSNSIESNFYTFLGYLLCLHTSNTIIMAHAYIGKCTKPIIIIIIEICFKFDLIMCDYDFMNM